MNSQPPVDLHPVVARGHGYAITLVALAVGAVVGLWAGRVLPAGPTRSTVTGTTEPGQTQAAMTHGPWIVAASLAPDLVQAYNATRQTSAGLGPVVCTTGVDLTCRGITALEPLDPGETDPAVVQIPGPEELWPRLTPAHLDASGAEIGTIIADDLSPALYSQVTLQARDSSRSWTAARFVTPVSVNGAVAFIDLGPLPVGRYVVVIRQVFSVPPDRYGLHESWKAIGLLVGS